MHESQRPTAKSRTTLPSVIGDDWSSGDEKANQTTMLGAPNTFRSGMKMAPEVAPLGPFPLVAGTGFEPATSGL